MSGYGYSKRYYAIYPRHNGWRFIHGGDTCDKGGVVGGSIRVVRTLCRLKRKYPNRVVLLLGNFLIDKRHQSAHDTPAAHALRRLRATRTMLSSCQRSRTSSSRSWPTSSAHVMDKATVPEAGITEKLVWSYSELIVLQITSKLIV